MRGGGSIKTHKIQALIDKQAGLATKKRAFDARKTT